MSINSEVADIVQSELSNLSISAKLDEDNELEIILFHSSCEISSTYVELDKVFLKIKQDA